MIGNHLRAEVETRRKKFKMRTLAKTLILALLLYAAGLAASSLPVDTTVAFHSRLMFVVILTRHGVRAPTWTSDRLGEYSAQPWPKWNVPPGYLTRHGALLMRLFGAYDRAYLAQAGLLTRAGCPGPERVYVWADSEERTLATGRALAAGMFPACKLEVHSRPGSERDALFHPFAAGITPPDRRLAAEAVSARMGGSSADLLKAHRRALDTLEQVLLDCEPQEPCPPPGVSTKRSLLSEPTTLRAGKGHDVVRLEGPLHTASTLTEDFLLEYAEGMSGRELGWDRINQSNLREMMTLHGAFADLTRQTPYIARARASNLLSHTLKSMEQAVAGRPVAGAIGSPAGRVLVLVGHDTNLSNVAGALGLSWRIRGYLRDDTPPGGALIFELLRGPAAGRYTVRIYFLCQTLNQMRTAKKLTLDSPPGRSVVVMPGCGDAGSEQGCSWTVFRREVASAIEPRFVQPRP